MLGAAQAPVMDIVINPPEEGATGRWVVVAASSCRQGPFVAWQLAYLPCHLAPVMPWPLTCSLAHG